MSLNFADLVVLGDDLSGITAGSLLAKRGMNVLLMDRPSARRPASIAGLQSQNFKTLLGRLGVPEGRFRAIKPNPISFQIILPDHRIDVSADNNALISEFEREFPSEVDWARQLFAEVEDTFKHETKPLLKMIPWTNWREKRRFLKQKNNFGWPRWTEELQQLSPELQTFFKAWILFIAGNPTSFIDAMQPFALLTTENRSTSMVSGGWHELKRLFIEKIEYFGGRVLDETPSDYTLETENARIRGVAFEGYHLTTRCRYLMGNGPVADLLAHLPQNFRTKRFCRSLNRTPSSREFTIQFLTSSAVLPEPMCQDIILVQDTEQPLIDTNFLKLQVIPLPDPPAPDEDVLLQASYFLPGAELLETSEATIERFEKRHALIETQIKKLMPFSQGKIRRLFPLPSINNSQEDLFGNPMDDYSRFFQQAVHETRFPPSYNFPSLTTPFNNLIALGPHQLGWLGMAGRLQSAIKAADYIWSRESKRRPM